MTDYQWPGVHIEETAAPGPIVGVGTSTAAFIGPALDGPINVPVRITSWKRFVERFGSYMTAPRTYLAYAVRSYFDNGGRTRTSCAPGQPSPRPQSRRRLGDREPPRATGRGARTGHGRQRHPDHRRAHLARDRRRDPQGARADRVQQPLDIVRMKSEADAARFAPGDWVTVEGPRAVTQSLRILNRDIFLTTAFTAQHRPIAWLRIDDVKNQRAFRVANAAGLEAGSAVHLADNATVTPPATAMRRTPLSRPSRVSGCASTPT